MIDNAAHTQKNKAHTSLVYSSIKTTVVTLIIASIFPVVLMVSCADPEFEYTPPTLIKQHIQLNQLPSRVIQTHSNFSNLDTNQAKEKHLYTVYRFPTTDTATLELTITLSKESDTKDKTFLLVTSNANTTKQDFSSILQPLHSVTKTTTNPDDVQLLNTAPHYSKTTTALFAKTKSPPDYNSLVAYNDNADNTPSTRTFKFRQNSKEYPKKVTQYPTKLYVKKEVTIEERTIRMLFWVQEDKLNSVTPRDARVVLQGLADRTLDNNGIYQDMYNINGGHIWDYDDSLKDNAASKDPTEIHIGIGNIAINSKNKKSNLKGFVAPYIAFKDKSKLLLSSPIEEEYYVPTVYLNIDDLNNATAAGSAHNRFQMYSTFVHELQHIAFYSSRKLQKPQYLYGRLIMYDEKQWVNELVSVSIEHILGHSLVQKVGGTLSQDLLKWSGEKYYQRLTKFRLITKYGLTPPNSDKGLDPAVYELYRVFSMYLLNNYGVDVLGNIMFKSDTSKKNGSAVFDAVKKTPFYDNSDNKTRPNNFSELVNDFYISILLSDTAYLGNGTPTSTLTFFAPQDTNLETDSNNIAQYGITTLPGTGNLAGYKSVTFNIINGNDSKNSSIQKPSNRSGIIPTEDLWTKGHGPIIDTPTTAQNTVQLNNSKGRFIYLGGRLQVNPNRIRSLAFTKDANNYLQLKLTISPGVVSSLVIVENITSP